MRTSWPWMVFNALFIACGAPSITPVVAPTEPSGKAATSTADKPANTPRPFDRGAAAQALAKVDVQPCSGTATGSGHVEVTFAPDGHVASAVVDEGPFEPGPVLSCIVAKFSAAYVPPFDGPHVRVGKSFWLSASDNTAPFDRGAAARALGKVDVGSCKTPAGPTGSGHVTVTFSPDGQVLTAVVDGGPFPPTSVGGCISTMFRTARVPAFGGPPVRVGKTFVIP